KMPESDILDIDSHYTMDTKITKIEYHSYIPYTNSFRNNDEIRIIVQQSDAYPYLHESFIYIVRKIAESTKVNHYNNGVSQLSEQTNIIVMKTLAGLLGTIRLYWILVQEVLMYVFR
ncbi:Hypothetical protein CINCED_3A021405, partial [Cinara cedri]